MGQGFGKRMQMTKLLFETQMFALWTLNDVRELLKRFKSQVFGYALVEAQFESIMAFKPDVAKTISLELLFEILDSNHDGRLDGLELLGGLTMCCQASFEEKAKFCFEVYDFNLNSTLSKTELVMMMVSCISGIYLLAGGGEEAHVDVAEFEKVTDDAFMRVDCGTDGVMSYDQFVMWARSNREVMAAIDSLNKLAAAAKDDISSEDSADELHEDAFSDFGDELAPSQGDQAEDDGGPPSYVTILEDADSSSNIDPVAELLPALKKSSSGVQGVEPWKTQIQEPTNFRHIKKDGNPDTNLDLCWAHGYHSEGRNNVRYIMSEKSPYPHLVVYPTASLIVVYDTNTKEQSFYQGHICEVTCLAIHPNGQVVASGDVSCNVQIWDTTSLQCLRSIKGLVKQGIQHISFSPITGDRIATVGLDSDHTIALYDSSTGEIMGSSKGFSHPNNVLAMAFATSGNEIVIVGRKQIKFFRNINSVQRALTGVNGKIGKAGKKQTFFCVAYFGDDAIVGCGNGELYRFKGEQMVQAVQAHTMNEPVLSICCNHGDFVMVTGCKDGIVKTWDSTLKEIGAPLDISEDLDGDGKPDSGSLNVAIMSVQIIEKRILIGTKGCDIYEAVMPTTPNESHTINRVTWGHFRGELWGLTVHPSRDEFATCGDDKTIRIWSIRTKEQLTMRQIPEVARALAYSSTGEIIAVGMSNGSAALLESGTLRVCASWSDSRQAITDIKFCPDSKILVLASKDSNIYVYKSSDRKTFKRQAICRGHSSPVMHVDISANSQYIISNSVHDSSLLYWDTKGNQVRNTSALRDIRWATQTCVFAWSTQGIWPADQPELLFTSADTLEEVKVLVTGDNQKSVKLFRYPAVRENAICQSYVGHSGTVTMVRFSSNRRYVISIGGADRTILMWKQEVEEHDSDGGNDGKASSSSSSSASDGDSDHPRLEKPNANTEVADVGDRSILQEAVNHHKSAEDLTSLYKLTVSNPEKNVNLWKASCIEPVDGVPSFHSTDVDLTVEWVHGYRSFDCRNNLRYSAAGAIVFHAASLGVVYSKSLGKQRFLQGVHSDDIIGMAAHPSCQIFATGETGRIPKIVVWNAETMLTCNTIVGVHRRGVPLLAFNDGGNLLASVGLDKQHTLLVHDWSSGTQVLNIPTDRRSVFCLCFLASAKKSAAMVTGGGSAAAAPTPSVTPSSDVIVTGGAKTLTFWSNRGQNVQSQRGLWKKVRKCTIMCIASSTPDICVTGSSDGRLIVWRNCAAVCEVKNIHDEKMDSLLQLTATPDYPHKESSINAIWCDKRDVLVDFSYCPEGDLQSLRKDLERSPKYITGDVSGMLAVWRLVEVNNEPRLVLMYTLNINHLEPKPMNAHIRSVCERNSQLLIGTKGCEIFEVAEKTTKTILEEKNLIDQAIKASSVQARKSPNRQTPVDQKSSARLTPTSKTNEDPQACSSARSRVEKGEVLEEHLGEPISCKRLISGSKEEIYGVAAHPFLPLYFTAGGDHSLRCWSLTPHKMISYIDLPEKARSIAILADKKDSELAVGMNSGSVWILKTSIFLNPKKLEGITGLDSTLDGDKIHFHVSDETEICGDEEITCSECHQRCTSKKEFFLHQKHEHTDEVWCDEHPISLTESSQWIPALKYSFEGSFLAVSSFDAYLYVYSVGLNRPESERYKLNGIYRASPTSSPIMHIDFGVICRKYSEEIVDKAALPGTAGVQIQSSTQVVGESYDPSKREINKVQIDLSKKIVSRPSRKLEMADLCMQTASGTAAGELFFWKLYKDMRREDVQSVTSQKLKIWARGSNPRIESVVPPECENQMFLGDDGPILGLLEDHFSSESEHWGLTTPSQCKDSWWASITCPFGWSVQGIWPNEMDGNDINAVALCNSWTKVPALVVADDYGRVRAFNYPCVNPGSADKVYRGHSAHVADLTFSFDDSYCISVGKEDYCVVVWKTDVQDEIRERDAIQSGKPKKKAALAAVGEVSVEDFEEPNKFKLNRPSGGDEMLAVKAWKGAVREPSGWLDPPNIGSTPGATLELKFVYGYRGWDCRNNIGFADSREEVCYHIAGVGVVYNSVTHSQIHNTEHDDDILCLAVHPEGHTVATGEIGKNPKLVIWDANTGVTIKTILFHKKGISHLGFSTTGELIISVGMDDERVVAVHNIRTGQRIGTGKVGRGVEVYALAVGSEYSFITGGKNTVKFWDIAAAGESSGELSSKGGIFGKNIRAKSVVSIAFLGSDPFTGMADGTIVLWKSRTSAKVETAHEGPVTAMCTIPRSGDLEAKVVSGGKDGKVIIWNMQLQSTWVFDLTQSTFPNDFQQSMNPQISALTYREDRLVLGTKAAEIYEVDTVTYDLHKLVEGHSVERAEVWGLAVHPEKQIFASCGDDCTVRLFDARSMKLSQMVSIETKARALAFSTDALALAVASIDGKIHVLSTDSLKVKINECQVGKDWIQALVYSPDSKTLAVGSHDSLIYLLSTKTYSIRAICRGHHATITQLDYSVDNSTLQSVSGDYELLYWDVATGKQIKSATAVRDTQWSTFTCKLGWPVQGIWSSGVDGTDVNSVCRSPDCTLLVSGDDSKRIKLFRFPCSKERSKFKEYKGHSEHIPNVRFSSDGKFVFSVGGLDKAIMQYEVKQPAPVKITQNV